MVLAIHRLNLIDCCWFHLFIRYLGRLRIVVDRVRGGIAVKGGVPQVSGQPLLLGGKDSGSFVAKVSRGQRGRGKGAEGEGEKREGRRGGGGHH